MYDIVFLSELKCDYVFAVPGFKCLCSRLIPGEEKRGGVAVLIKVNLWNYVYSVSSMKDHVWFTLKCTPKIKYGCVYIAPRDSLFFSPESFAMLSQQCNSVDKLLVAGDLNARIPNLQKFSVASKGITFIMNPDPRSNANCQDLTTVCQTHNLVPLNHLMH